jgi:UDP-N-acetylglucosamine 4,6-dehydratase
MDTKIFNDKEILIIGGTGSLGTTLTRLLLEEFNFKGIRLYSRDEAKHWVLKNKIAQWKKENPYINTPVSYCIGDVRDEGRLSLAMNGANIVIQAAAMKQVPACEDNPMEAIKTNIMGTQNVIMAALANKSVERVFNIGTDKDVEPLNLYGGTKFVAEKLIINANTYSHGKDRIPKFYSFRYGNIIGSKGSVVQLFREQMQDGEITITDINMTRFWVSLERVARFIMYCIGEALNGTNGFDGGEIFIPQMPSASILEIANIIAPDSTKVITGIRQGEKLHELMINWHESFNTEIRELPIELKNIGLKNFFIVHHNKKVTRDCSYGFTYSSQTNPWKLDNETLTSWIEEKYAY